MMRKKEKESRSRRTYRFWQMFPFFMLNKQMNPFLLYFLDSNNTTQRALFVFLITYMVVFLSFASMDSLLAARILSFHNSTPKNPPKNAPKLFLRPYKPAKNCPTKNDIIFSCLGPRSVRKWKLFSKRSNESIPA
jgi:hypothetical protein